LPKRLMIPTARGNQKSCFWQDRG